MQHDPVDMAHAQALHPTWRADDTILARLAQNAAEVPDQIAMRERDHGIWQEYTWADYLRAVLEFAAGLDARGVKPGDVVLVIGDNRPKLYFAMLGAACLRAIPSPAYADAPTEELAAQMEREDIRTAVAEDQEQVDKMLEAGARWAHLDLIVYDDPRGLAGREPDGVAGFDAIRAEGAARLAADPGLAAALIGRSTVHDIVVLMHSSGTTGALGRADQAAKVKGMFVRPEQVAAIGRAVPGCQRLRLEISRAGEQDRMRLLAEHPDSDAAAALADKLAEITRLKGTVEVVAPGSLPNDGRVIADLR